MARIMVSARNIYFKYLFLAVKNNMVSEAICPEKKRSLVITWPVPIVKTRGSIRLMQPAGTSRGVKYIAINLNSTITINVCIASIKYLGWGIRVTIAVTNEP